MVAKIIEELRKIPERDWLQSDKNVEPIAFYPFRDFYGGYLLYRLNGNQFKTWIGNKAAKRLGVKEVYIYGRRAT